MKIEQVVSVFQLAGFDIKNLEKLPNNYCPKSIGCELCANSPWWNVTVEKYGTIQVGWRKRVINIDWKATGYKFPEPDAITKDDVTKDPTYIHAWGYGALVTYLISLRQNIDHALFMTDERKIKLAEIEAEITANALKVRGNVTAGDMIEIIHPDHITQYPNSYSEGT